MSAMIEVTIPSDNGYSDQLNMLKRVEEHISALPGVNKATISEYKNPFEVSVEPPSSAALVARVLTSHYGFEAVVK